MPDLRFDYSHVPTIGQFARSDAFVRGLCGPFGSGKSSGCIIEFAHRAHRQAPGRDGVRRTRWAVVRNCFDSQTEILTETRGWQLFKDLMPEDRVATLQNGTDLVYERPCYYYSAHYKGEMIGARSDGIDMLVTPDHRLWTSKRKTRKKEWAPFAHERASDAFGHHLRRFKRNADWQGGSARYSEDFYEFLGFWFAEGYAGAYNYPDRKMPHYRFVVVQKRVEYTRNLLARAGLKWGEHYSPESGCTYFRIKISDELKPLVAELATLGHAPQKHLPIWLKNAPRGHASAFLNGYFRGDGSRGVGRHRVLRATTASPRLADDIQELALRAGLVVNIRRRRSHNSAMLKDRGYAPTTEWHYALTFTAPSRWEPAPRGGWYKVDYDDMVYCVEVSSHVVYVRRNGVAHWSGQTASQLRDTTIQTVFNWLPPHYFGRYFVQDARYVVKAFDGVEFELLFRALDRPEDVRKLLSLDLTGAWINEAREVPWAVVEAVMGRCGRYPSKDDGGATWSGVWMDTNPPDVDSKWYKFFEEEDWRKDFDEMLRSGSLPPSIQSPDDYAQIFHQPSGLSPEAENLHNLPAGYYQRLGIGKSSEWKKVYIDGRYGFVSDDKTVFPEYRDEIHLKAKNPVPGVPIQRQFDFGLTPACSFSQILPNGQWLIFDEMVSESMGIDRFSDEVLEHCAKSFRGATVEFDDIADPAGQQRAQTDEKTCFEILHAKGIKVEGGEQNLRLRLESVRKALRTLGDNGEPRLVLHPRCRNIRKAFLGGYHYRRLATNSERFATDPEKNHPYSDLMDGIEYRAAQLFGAGLTGQYPQDDYPRAARSTEGKSTVTGY